MEKFGRDYHREYYRKRRKAIFDYLGGACVICGTTEHLQVDHINPADKSFEIKSRLSVKNNKAELDKCQLLCRRHHLEKTARENSGFQHGTIYAWMKKKCKCEVCESAKRAWYDERNARRRKN
jgi:5-methylcytosine-specific restriction endonuclease McrA